MKRKSAAVTRVSLSRGWTLWPLALVRGAGFPVSLVEGLRAPALASAARETLSGTRGLEQFSVAWAEARPAVRSVIREYARSPRLREAISWQNRSAVENGLDSLLRAPADRDDAKLRKKETMVVSYLQRYVTKCDTIGFFGPLGWARWEGPGQVEQTPDAALLDAREVFFEPWAIAAVVDAVAGDDEGLEAMPLRLTGHARVSLMPARSLERRIAARIDGVATTKTIGAALKVPRETVLQTVRALIAAGLVDLAVPVPISHRPEEVVLRAAKRLSKVARTRLTQAMTSLVAAREAVASAAGDVETLTPALVAAEATFTGLAETSARRHEGRTYAGRSILYEETRRAGQVRLGDELRATLDAPLTVLLELARLYTARIAHSLSQALEREFTKTRSRSVPLVDFWLATASHFEGDPPPAVRRAVDHVQSLVTRTFGPLDPSAREVRWSSAVLEKALRRQAAAATPGWPGARHHAPDVMLARRGDRLVPVLGELHTGVTPFSTLSVLSLTPHRAELEALYRSDLPGPHVTPIPWEDFSRSTHDTRLAADADRWHVDLGFRFSSPLPAARVRRAAELQVRRGARGLEVVGKGFRQPAAAVFERRIKLRAANDFHPTAWTSHRPRVWLDEVVIAREAWRLDASMLAAWARDEAPARFLEVTRTALALQWPRFVFAKSPGETKPIFVDLESPALVELLCKQARGAASLVVSEMLAAPDECWLEDAEGARYVAELRLLAVDPRTWVPTPNSARRSP
ncbi:MAG: lantibiotic dehydratase [Myxococcales bacterium]|nr:lantibiotic dehydratase [Myxococcales bacterium]